MPITRVQLFFPERAQRSRAEIRGKVEKKEREPSFGMKEGRLEIMLLFVSLLVSVYSRWLVRVCVGGLVLLSVIQMWAYLSADRPFCKMGSASLLVS